MDIQRIEKWLVGKNFTQEELAAIDTCSESYIERETEKALLIKWPTKYGTISKWIPKSCIRSEEEVVEEVKAKIEKSEDRLNKREALIEFAKENGLKVRVNNKIKKIVMAIKEANLLDKLDESLQSYASYVLIFY